MEEKIEILIAKYFVNEITELELNELKTWINKPGNKAIYKEYIDINYGVESSKEKTYSQEDYNKLKQLLQAQKKQNRFLKSIIKYAAVFLGLIVTGYAFYYNSQTKFTKDAQSIIKNEDVTLVLGNGDVKKINPTNESKIVNTNGNVLGVQVGNEIVYNKKQEESITIATNTLNVPFGKRFKVTLNDGTQVHLNAGSTLTYPEIFKDNQPREVQLSGEAYFAVSKDKRSFIVNSKNIDAKVLGTQFTFSAYPNSEENYVVLVEGSLAVKKIPASNTELVKSMLLKPNQKASLNLTKNNAVKITNVNVAKYISWKVGELYFENEPFNDILIKLKRHYNVTIVNNNKQLSKARFTGRFNNENILDILNAFKLHTDFNYSIKNGTIVIE